MSRQAIRLIPAVMMLLAGCSNDGTFPRPEVSAHGTWTFGMSKSL